MDSDIFKPFKVIEQSSTYLHLAEPKTRKGFLFFFFRIYPFLLAVAIAVTLIAFEFSLDILLMLAGIGIVILLLFTFKNFVQEVQISRLEISITYQTFFGKRIKTVLINDAEKITVETLIFSTIGGFYYRIKLKDSKKDYEIFAIPRLYMKEENKIEINKILEEISGLKVVKW